MPCYLVYTILYILQYIYKETGIHGGEGVFKDVLVSYKLHL